jgi:class 3 adenylate cyclase
MRRIQIRSQSAGIQLWSMTLLCLLMCLTGRSVAASVPSLQLDLSAHSQTLDGHVEVLFDEGKTLSEDDVRMASTWKPVGNQPYAKGLENGIVWLRFRIENPSDQTIERVLEISQGLSDEATLWLVYSDDSTERYEAGENTDVADRVIATFLPHFPVDLGPGMHVDALLRLTDEGTMTAPLVIAEQDHLQAQEGTRQWINGLMSGVLGLVGIYSLVLYIRIRRTIFGWLSALAAASLMQWLFYHWGQAGVLLPTDVRPWVVNRMIVSSFEVTAFCSLFFFISACELREYRPRITRVIIGLGWLSLANAALIFVLPYSVGVAILFASGPLAFLILSIAVLIRAAQGDPVSRQLTLAVLLLMTGYTLSVLTESGVVPRTWLSPYYIPMGTLAQWLLLSEAVALRARHMEEQRRAALEAQLAEERRSGELREAFGRYVAPDLAEKILDDPEYLALGGRLQTITILMSDLRGFTGMTRRLGPPAMCELLNDYLGRMTEVIDRHGGWVNEFIGDAILTLFGTPVASKDDSLNACRCAIEMQIVLDQMNQELRQAGRPTLEMGIGLHTGEAIVGNIGSARRVKWGVIGDTVNMTARIESLTIGTQILISTVLLDQVQEKVASGPKRQVQVKGRTQLLEVAELRAILGEDLSMPETTEVDVMDTKRAAKIHRLEGKTLSEEFEDVSVIRLSPAGLVFEGDSVFIDGTDLALRISKGDEWTEPIYGKVSEFDSQATGERRTPVIFTSLAPVTRAWIESLSD